MNIQARDYKGDNPVCDNVRYRFLFIRGSRIISSNISLFLQHLIKGTSKNAPFPRLRRQLRAQILMYPVYTAVLRAVLPGTHEKSTIFRGALKFISWFRVALMDWAVPPSITCNIRLGSAF